MIPGIAIRQHRAHWAFWNDPKQISGDPSHETFLKKASFSGAKALVDVGRCNPLAEMKQQMAEAGFSCTSHWVISAPMPSLAERSRLSLLARNAGIDRIRLLPSVAAAAAELCVTDTALMEDMENESEYNIIVWKDACTIEICLVEVGNGILEFMSYGARRYVEERQTAEVIRMIMEDDILTDVIPSQLKKGKILMNSLPSDAEDVLVHLAANNGWDACVEYWGETDLYGCMRIAGKLSGYGFTHDFVPLLMTEYGFKILKNDQQTIEVMARNSTIPARNTRPDEKHPCKIQISDITDRFGMATILVSCPFSPQEYDLIRIPVYKIWNGKNAEENAQVTIDIDADLCIDITIKNTDNNKELVFSWKEICEQICDCAFR